MNSKTEFHIISVGMDHSLIEGMFDRINDKSKQKFSHIVHPRHTIQEWPDKISHNSNIFFFREKLTQIMPAPDRQLLASLEQEGVPTIHNMIMSDRVVSKLNYDDALCYTSFLTQRLFEVFSNVKPSLVIGAFDSLHASIAQAVSKRMGIPWFALHFSIIPPGFACFCDQMTPAARVKLSMQSKDETLIFAEESLRNFMTRDIEARAYIAPSSRPFFGKIANFPKRLKSVISTLKKSQISEYIKFTEEKSSYNIITAVSELYSQSRSRKALLSIKTLNELPNTPYVLFGLHMQPESTIDVWAPFYSNQMRVIELLARSIPPTHKLLVKVHKSDVSNHSRKELDRMQAFPGVELIAPFADTRKFIDNADLIIAIQGTMGLEAALLGKPVIMLGESPVNMFPSASPIGKVVDLPALIRNKLKESLPNKAEILNAYVSFLAPFFPASDNEWSIRRTDKEIDGYVNLFQLLEKHVKQL